MDSKEKKLFVGAFRRMFLWSRARKRALSDSRIARGKYLCAECGRTYSLASVEVDHIKPLSKARGGKLHTWAASVSRLLLDPENLQVLCRSCHSDKTWRQSK